VWKVKNGEFERISSINVRQGSIGILYEFLAERLRLGRLEGPGKVMGLAPYGKRDDTLMSKMERIIKIPEKADMPYTFASEFQKSTLHIDRMYEDIVDFVTSGYNLDWNPRKELSTTAANLAWCTQYSAERAILATASWAKEQTGEDNLSLAGGVALNAKANMELYYSRMYNDLFVFPAANDAGGPIGAAAYVYEHVLGGKMKHGRLANVYLGNGYSNETIKKVVTDSKWKAEYVKDNVDLVAELVARGKIVTWYQGRSELGPRALGNRSIVADPTLDTTWKSVNEVKGREFWRPLSPSLLSEDKGRYFDMPTEHEFMVLMFKASQQTRELVPAVCHVDMTARPQTVTKSENELWYELIRSFKERSGVGVVMNTSFNLAGEPLVESPQDALRSFSLGGFDAIFLQGWLIRKNG
jgi:carbamoyltransferase